MSDPAFEFASPLLQALYESLEAAGSSLSLGPGLLAAPQITRLFDRLLGFPDDTIPVSGAAVSCTPQTVTLQGTVELFTAAVSAELVFTVAEEQLELVLTADLGPSTVLGLYTSGILPPGLNAPADWASGLAPLPELALRLSSRTCLLEITGTPAAEAWNVLGLAGVSLAPVQPAIQVFAPPGPPPLNVYTPRLTTHLQIGGTVRIPIYVELPIGVSGWQLGIDARTGFNLASLSSLAPLLGGDTTNLPAGVLSLGDFWLHNLDVQLQPQTPNVWWIDLGIRAGRPGQPGPTWTILDKVLAIGSVRADLSLVLAVLPGATVPTASASGSITGDLEIGGVPAQIAVDVPAGPDGWRLTTCQPLRLPGLASLAPFLGRNMQRVKSALGSLGTLGGLSVESLEVFFQLSPRPALTSLTAVIGARSWRIPALPWFELKSLLLELSVAFPGFPPDPIELPVSGRVSGQMKLGPLLLQLAAGFEPGQITASLQSPPTELTPLSAIVDAVGAGAIGIATPPGFPVSKKFSLDRFKFVYDTFDGYLSAIEVAVTAETFWQVIPGALSIWGLKARILVTQAASNAAAVVSGEVSGKIELGGAKIRVKAFSPAPGADWTFAGSLAQSRILDFRWMLADLLPGGPVLPAGYGFPTSMEIRTAEVSFVPQTGAFNFSGEAFLEWSIAFAGATFSIDRLGATVALPGSGSDAPSTATVTGAFTFGAVKGDAELQLGSAGAPTVLSVAVAAGSAIDPATIVDELCAGDGGDPWRQAPVPAGFPVPSYASAGLVLNLTDSTFLLYGQAGGDGLYGALALLVEQVPEGPQEEWGFLFAAMLQTWSFAQLSAGLAGVGAVLEVEQASACVVLSLLQEEDAGALLSPYIPALPADLQVSPGLNFFGSLQFNANVGLTGLLPSILDVTGPLTLQGSIPADASQSVFKATLGSLTLLGFLSFNDIQLVYQVAQGSSLQLSGTIVVALGFTQLSFQGDLAVDSTAANFSLTTPPTQSIPEPLGIPGITLEQLALDLDYTFAAGGTPASYSLAIAGAATLAGVGVTGSILFQDGAAALVLVEIASLSVDGLFQQCVGTSWPEGLLDITFEGGELYYAPAAVTLGDTTYAQGFHASSTVSIYSLGSVLLTVDIVQNSGITASAQWASPIDWGFLQLNGGSDQPDLGPSVLINSATETFTLAGGLSLFSAPAVDVTIQVEASTMTGKIKFSEEIPPFGTPTLAFTWDDEGFHIDEWSLGAIQLPEFWFDNLPSAGCGPSGVSIPVSTEVDLTPSLSIQLVPSPQLVITLNGSLGLVVDSAAYPPTDLVTVQIVNTTLTVPLPGTGSFTWSDLANSFVLCLQEAAESLFSDLLEPDKIGKLLMVAGAQFGVQKLQEHLTCKGLEQAAAEIFAEAATQAVATTVVIGVGVGLLTTTVGGVIGEILNRIFKSDGSPIVLEGLEPVPSAPAAPNLSYDYVKEELQVSWAAVPCADLYSVVWQADDGAKHSEPTGLNQYSLSREPGPLFSVQVVASGLGGVSKASPVSTLQTFAPLAAPQELTASFVDPVLSASWPAVAGATGYSAALSQGGQPLTPSVQFAGTSCTMQDPAFEQGGTFTVSVNATAGPTVGPAASTQVVIGVLPAPANLALTLSGASGTSVLATWSPVPGAAGYQVQVLQGGIALSPQPSIALQGETATISGPPLQQGQTYQVEVQATAPGEVGTWSAASIVLLSAPSGLSVLCLPGLVQVSFSPVSGATGYQAQILDSQGQPLSPPLMGAAQASPMQVDASRLQPGGQYSIEVRATSGSNLFLSGDIPMPSNVTVMGPFSTPATPFVYTQMSAPQGFQAIYNPPSSLAGTTDSVTASWSSVTDATGYSFEVLGASAPISATLTGTAITLQNTTGTALQAGSTYTIQVAATGSGATSAWSTLALTLPSSAVPAPASSSILPSQASSGVQVAFDAPSPPAGATYTYLYQALLFDANGNAITQTGSASPITVEAVGSTPFFVSGVSYSVEVAALILDTANVAAPDQFQVTFTPAANGTPASFTGSWSAVSNETDGYTFEIINLQTGNVLNLTPITPPNPTSLILQDQSSSVLTASTTYQALVYASGVNCGPLLALFLTTPPSQPVSKTPPKFKRPGRR